MSHHRRGLRRLLRNDALLVAIENDWKTADLGPRRWAMLTYSDKLTRTPGAMTEDDVQALRQEGFGDADILAIAEVTAYFAYVNRIADGLGVAVESTDE